MVRVQVSAPSPSCQALVALWHPGRTHPPYLGGSTCVTGVLPFQVCRQGHQPCCAFYHYCHHWDEATLTNHSAREDLNLQAVCGASHTTGNVPQVPSGTPLPCTVCSSRLPLPSLQVVGPGGTTLLSSKQACLVKGPSLAGLKPFCLYFKLDLKNGERQLP